MFYGFGLCLLECLLVYLMLIFKNVGGEISLYITLTEILTILILVQRYIDFLVVRMRRSVSA